MSPFDTPHTIGVALQLCLDLAPFLRYATSNNGRVFQSWVRGHLK